MSRVDRTNKYHNKLISMENSQVSYIGSQFDRSMMNQVQTQDDSFIAPACTPREATSNDFKLFKQVIASPTRKKRGRPYTTVDPNIKHMGLLPNQASSSNDFKLLLPIEKKDDNDGPNYLFNLSQDDALLSSQFSQDFNDRFGSQKFTIKGPEDSCIQDTTHSNIHTNTGISNLCYQQDSQSNDPYQIPFSTTNNTINANTQSSQQSYYIPFTKHRNTTISNPISHLNKENVPKKSTLIQKDEDCQVNIPPPQINPFLPTTGTGTDLNLKGTGAYATKGGIVNPTAIWVKPYTEWPR